MALTTCRAQAEEASVHMPISSTTVSHAASATACIAPAHTTVCVAPNSNVLLPNKHSMPLQDLQGDWEKQQLDGISMEADIP